MVEIKDIDSDEKLYKWLKEQPKNYSAVIADRRSMRLLPKIWLDVIGEHYAVDQTYFPIFAILRANLISGLKSIRREASKEKKFRIAAIDARDFLFSKLEKYENSFGNFINLSGAGYAADAITVSAYDNVSAGAYYPYDDISEMMDWSALQSDILRLTTNDLLRDWPLWGDVASPLFVEWERVKEGLNADSLNWSFWTKWYEAVLNGEPLNGDMLERIALLPPEDWKKGPRHVNTLIAKIEEEFESGATETDRLTAPNTNSKDKLVLRAVAEGVSAQVSDVIERYFQDTRKNELPEEFRALQELPELFASLARGDESSDYQAQIEKLKGKIKELEAGLKIAQSKSVSGTFSKAFFEQAGKSLGDWKMWGALGGGAAYIFVGGPAQTGTTGIMDSVSNIMNSVRGIFPVKP